LWRTARVESEAEEVERIAAGPNRANSSVNQVKPITDSRLSQLSSPHFIHHESYQARKV